MPFFILRLQFSIILEIWFKLAEVSMKIRYGTIDDAAMLADLGAKTFYDTYASDNTAENISAYIGKSFSTEIQSNELADTNIIFLIAELENRPVGYAKLKLDSRDESIRGTKQIEIERIYSMVEYIGKGIGKALMQAAIDDAKQRGCNSIWLGVWEKIPERSIFTKSGVFTKLARTYLRLGMTRNEI